MPDEPTLREATVADVAVLAHHRAAMFREMESLDDGSTARVRDATEAWLRVAMPRGEYRAWVAEAEGAVVAGVGLHVRPILPRLDARGALLPEVYGHVVNVYTEPAWRRRGIAERLMRRLLADTQPLHGRGITLHASDDGRPLYEKLGFLATNEMRLIEVRSS
jgi:GNAT superfamily N-acetyltransferase